MKKAVEYLRYSSDTQTEQSIEGHIYFDPRLPNVFIIDLPYLVMSRFAYFKKADSICPILLNPFAAPLAPISPLRFV